MWIFEKQPSEVVDYAIKMTDWFAPLDDADYITGIVVTCDPAFGVGAGDLQLGPGALPETSLVMDKTGLDRIAKVWIGAGTDGVTYHVTAVITTFLLRVEEVDFKVKVKEIE
jgi:hypothetical protein